MAEERFQLRAYVHLDRMQPQYAAFVGAITQGDPPIEGMASLYVEMAPGNWVFRVIDKVVKSTDVRPGAQIVEREFGMFEVHSLSQADVLRAGEVTLEELGRQASDRVKPEVASMQVITNVNPYQAQLLNRFTRGTMLVAGQTMLVMEVAPAAYINLAANEAEKAAPVSLMHVTSVGRFGRLWMAGNEADILAARDAAVTAIEAIEGQAERP
jgi:ethanolamine utilization microcompartment shell protein EutL